MEQWKLFAVGAIIAWSLWGLFLKTAVDRGCWSGVSFVSIAVEMVLIAAIWLLHGGLHETYREGWMLPAIGSGVCGIAGLILFNLALERGPLSIVSPVTSVYPVLTCALAYLFLSETMTPRQIAAVFLAIAAVILAG